MQVDGKPVDMKKFLWILSAGRIKEQPFDQKVVEDLRSDVRIALKRSGFGTGLPEEGDQAQEFEIRLVGALREL